MRMMPSPDSALTSPLQSNLAAGAEFASRDPFLSWPTPLTTVVQYNVSLRSRNLNLVKCYAF